MSCCAHLAGSDAAARCSTARNEISIASRALGEDLYQVELSVPGVHCAGCIRAVETGLMRVSGIEEARVNLTTKRVRVKWRGKQPPDLSRALENLGFPGHLTDAGEAGKDPALGRLIRALAVAGFSAMNIMLLSVSIWSGAEAATRDIFHWISAVLALPALLYSGRIFFISAWDALRRGRTNMDVPISVGICLAFGLSLYDTIHGGPHAYFDAATSLIFFLLIGRTLDHVMRERARVAVRGLARLTPHGATILRDDGRRDYLPVDEIEPGMRIALAAGDRIPVDGVISEGMSDLDCSIATGESAPRRVEVGSAVQAGMLNLSGPLIVVASARSEASFLAEMMRLMEAAEGGRARYRRLADRAAALYSPVIHAAAFLTFLGWMLATGDWHTSITVAIAALIITCPCALGLAVPIVQVMAARRLFENGVLVKDGSAIERIAEIDGVVFDKTGTLTTGKPRLVVKDAGVTHDLAIASAIASLSHHPLSRTIAAEGPTADVKLSEVSEHAGLGIEARVGANIYRLGRPEWALADNVPGLKSNTVLGKDGQLAARYEFEDELRPQAVEAVDSLREAGLHIAILSGDASAAVSAVAAKLDTGDFASGLLPADKVSRLQEMAAVGRKVLMVGDGINDAPALAAAYVSMAPASAVDVGRNAADFVFLREGLDPIPTTLAISQEAGRLVRQNFILAITYNAIALPVAIAGFVTPLVAALAMSFSSVLVVANALRLKPGKLERRVVSGSSGRASPRRFALEPAE
ncbi:MAG: cation-translocating P-type ATPase [Hyphomicrobiaceae bacterium]